MNKTRHISFNEPGHAHFLTFSCFRRCQLFTDNCACRFLAQSIDRAHDLLEFDLWAYVFMPDHIHLLIRPWQPEYSMPQILSAIKGPFAKRLLKTGKRDIHIDSNGCKPVRQLALAIASGSGAAALIGIFIRMI